MKVIKNKGEKNKNETRETKKNKMHRYHTERKQYNNQTNGYGKFLSGGNTITSFLEFVTGSKTTDCHSGGNAGSLSCSSGMLLSLLGDSSGVTVPEMTE